MSSWMEKARGFVRMLLTLETLPPPASVFDANKTRPPRTSALSMLLQIEELPQDPAPVSQRSRRSLWSMLFSIEELEPASPAPSTRHSPQRSLGSTLFSIEELEPAPAQPVPSARRRPYLKWLLIPEKLD